ncbi:RNHCP domain-containing protein [bacterium]|nr:RNHCP domain-containing protein [bacterium]
MKKINESFTCIHCGQFVPLAPKTCRNHCPKCFCSLHLDDKIPGDRTSTCKGKMFPINYEIKNGEFKILFQCETCGKLHWNKKAEDDEIDTLLKIVQEKRINP